jgi:hypothetical protein
LSDNFHLCVDHDAHCQTQDNILLHEGTTLEAVRHLCRQPDNYANASVGKALNGTLEAALPRNKRFYKDTCKLVTRGKASLLLRPAKVEIITGGEPKVKVRVLTGSLSRGCLVGCESTHKNSTHDHPRTAAVP